MQVRKKQLEMDMEQQTGSKLGKEYIKAVYCDTAYLTYMQSTSFQLSYSKSWKRMLWKCYTQHVSKFGKLSSGHKTGKGQFSFQSQRKAMPKDAQTTAQLH